MQESVTFYGINYFEPCNRIDKNSVKSYNKKMINKEDKIK